MIDMWYAGSVLAATVALSALYWTWRARWHLWKALGRGLPAYDGPQVELPLTDLELIDAVAQYLLEEERMPKAFRNRRVGVVLNFRHNTATQETRVRLFLGKPDTPMAVPEPEDQKAEGHRNPGSGGLPVGTS